MILVQCTTFEFTTVPAERVPVSTVINSDHIMAIFDHDGGTRLLMSDSSVIEAAEPVASFLAAFASPR